VSIRVGAASAGFADFVAKAFPGGFVFSLAEGMPDGARVILADVSGRVAWSGAFASGARELAWDGRDARGARAVAGVYVARLIVPDGRGGATVASRRVALSY
jgi:hypothetical protein